MQNTHIYPRWKSTINKQQVPIVDRKGDTVKWLRACPNSLWLIRYRKTSTVVFGAKSYKIQELAQQLDSVPHARDVRYQGKIAYQTIANCPVTLTHLTSCHCQTPVSCQPSLRSRLADSVRQHSPV